MSRNIKVAMFAQNYLPHLGGAERQIAALAPVLAQRGVEVSIVTRQCAGGTRAFELMNGVPVYRSPAPNSRALASLLFTAHALYRVRQIKPDVIHAHELLSPTSAALLAKRLYGWPVVAKILRGGYLGDIFKVLRGKGGKWRMSYIASRLDYFLAISTEIAEEVGDQKVPAERIKSIPNGVDTHHFSPVSAAVKQQIRGDLGIPDVPICLYAGRLSEEKNLTLLLSVWATLREQIPDAVLILAGDGDQRTHLEQLAGKGVQFLGIKSDLRDYYRAADVFVLPSQTEGMSNSLLEAMSTGNACVVTEVGAASELISHGQNGLMCTPGDGPELLRNLLDAFMTPGTLGEQARKLMQSNYSLEHVADLLQELYSDIVSHKHT